ncbi:MAG: endonuclease/exonuclease/phosphatase family protein [Verrucomicrobiales bacterium]|nr:endonuclease/exonuclease/phosphatase family protein [Verrucomicrobiota bacterium JB025]
MSHWDAAFVFSEAMIGFSRWLAGLVAAAGLVVSLGSCGRREDPPKAVAVAEDGRMELKLMTFNLRYENSGDSGRRAWRERVMQVVRVVMDERPDVLGVQEGLHGQVADLRASLPGYGFYGVGRDDGKRRGEYAALFFRKDRFEVDGEQCGTLWLSATPELAGSATWGNELPRVATWVRLVDRSNGRGLTVFNTHWDHRHQGSREKAAGLLRERIAALGDGPVVVMGDFNATGRNPALGRLTDGGALVETFQALRPDEADRTTLHFWKGSRSGRLKVDHILVSAGAEVVEAAIRDGDVPLVSDHFPVTARVIFPK